MEMVMKRRQGSPERIEKNRFDIEKFYLSASCVPPRIRRHTLSSIDLFENVKFDQCACTFRRNLLSFPPFLTNRNLPAFLVQELHFI